MAKISKLDKIDKHLNAIKRVKEGSDTHNLLQELAYREFLLFKHEADLNWSRAKWHLASWAVDNHMKATTLEDSINRRVQKGIKVSEIQNSDRTAAIRTLAEEIAKEYIKIYDGPYRGQEL